MPTVEPGSVRFTGAPDFPVVEKEYVLIKALLSCSPSSVQINCNTSAPIADVEETETAGGSSLSYDSATDRYKYVWKTESSWKNTCRQLTLTLRDGTVQIANFKFK